MTFEGVSACQKHFERLEIDGQRICLACVIERKDVEIAFLTEELAKRVIDVPALEERLAACGRDVDAMRNLLLLTQAELTKAKAFIKKLSNPP